MKSFIMEHFPQRNYISFTEQNSAAIHDILDKCSMEMIYVKYLERKWNNMTNRFGQINHRPFDLLIQMWRYFSENCVLLHQAKINIPKL